MPRGIFSIPRGSEGGMDPKKDFPPPNLLKLVAESRGLLLHLDKHTYLKGTSTFANITITSQEVIICPAEIIELILGATCFHPSQQNTVPIFCAVKFYSFAYARKELALGTHYLTGLEMMLSAPLIFIYITEPSTLMLPK
jgi:hypothetical protein